MKNNEKLYVNSAIIGSLGGLFLTVFAYLSVMLFMVGETFIVSFLVMASFGIFIGLLAAFLLQEAHKLLGIKADKKFR